MILPDFFRKEAWSFDKPFGPELVEWIKKFTWEKVGDDINSRVLPFLAERGAKKLGIAGTCWGAWVVLHSCCSDKFSCGVSWHPSFQVEAQHGGKEEELAEKVTCPQLILPAGGDQPNVMEDGEVIKILKSKPFGDAVEHKVFKEVAHGYMTRSDLTKEENAKAVKEGMELALAFFAKHLK